MSKKRPNTVDNMLRMIGVCNKSGSIIFRANGEICIQSFDDGVHEANLHLDWTQVQELAAFYADVVAGKACNISNKPVKA
jgi:hypothetical protein